MPDDARAPEPAAPLRVCIVQGIVPHYRIAIFDRLARTAGIELEVWGHLGPARTSLRSGVDRAGFVCRDAPERYFGPFLSQPAQREAVRCGRFDVVVFAWNQRYLQLRPALRDARRRGVGTCLWGHGYSKRDTGLRRWRRNALLRLADGCLVYGDAAREALIADGVPAERVTVARNAIDQEPIVQAIETWTSSPERLDAFRAANGLEGRRAILFLARVEPEKRPEQLVEALARLRPRHPDLSLVIIGEGGSMPNVRETATRLGVEDAVRLPGALYDETSIAPWCLSARCAAYPSAIGLSLLHDFGYGLPVVTSDDLGSHGPEIAALRDGHNGFLCRDGDVEDLAARIEACLDGSTHSALSVNAKATVSGPEGFTIENMLAGMLAGIHACAHGVG